MADRNINIKQLASAKKLEINISREEKKNEPNITLGHLVELVQSITDSFSPGKKVDFPDVYSLQLLDGISQPIQVRGSSLPFVVNRSKQQDIEDSSVSSPISTVLGQLYPDDIASILKSVQFFVDEEYGKNRQFNWGYKIDDVIYKINSAPDPESLQKTATGQLKRASQETLAVILRIHQEILDKAEVELEDVKPIISEIKDKFKNSNNANEYQKIWEDLAEETTKALASSTLNTQIVTVSDKNFAVGDARKIINAFHEQIIAQYEKKKEIKSPWDRASAITKKRFNPQQRHFFSTNELQEINVVIADTVKARKFTEWIEQLLKELQQEPTKAKTVAEETAEEQEGGGEEEVVDDKQIDFFTKEEIIKKAIDALSMRSGKIFLSHFSEIIEQEKLSREQKDWLLTRLTTHIQDLLDQKSIQQELINEISNWIPANLEPENKENKRFKISVDQHKKLDEFLAKQFFTQYSNQFLKLIEDVPSTDELDIDAVKVDVPKKEAIVPPTTTETAESTQVSGEVIDRNKFISETTQRFLSFYFDAEGEAFREIAFSYIAENTPKTLTAADLLRLRLRLFNELKLNRKLFNSTQEYYQKKLSQLGLDDAKTKLNFYNTLDSILVLVEDPHKYLDHISDKQLTEYFAIEGTQVDIKQLRFVLRGLIFVRRAHYFFNRNTPIKPWLEKHKLEQASQYLSQLRGFVKDTEEEGVMALNLDEDGIKKSTIDEKRKALIRKLYQDLWTNAVAGKSPEELRDIYIFYGVDVIKIDYKVPPVPDGFIYSDMAQHANLDSPTSTQAKKAGFAKQLFSESKKKLGKLALTAVAPELAPILAALEKLPIIGTAVKELEERAGDLLSKVLSVLAVGLTIFFQFIAKSLLALIGGISGGIIGGIIGGPLGAVGGAAAGTGIGLLIDKAGGVKRVGSLFGSGGTEAGIGTKARALAKGGFGPAIPNALVPATIGGTVAGSALMIATTSVSMLHPINNTSDIIPGAELNISKYAELNKTADITKIENSQNTTITYTIVITPKDEYIIKINTNETKDKWSYLGGDTINLPDQSQKILKQIGEEPLSDPVTITYSVDMSGVDVAVSNNFILSFEAIDEVGAVIDMDSISAFETVIIGEPEIGCLVAGAAGETWGGVPTLSWSGSNWNRVLNILSKRAGTSTQFMSLVCAGDTPLQTFLLKGGFDEGYGGWAPSSFVGAKVGLYEYGLSFKESSLEYTLVHELGHIIDYRNPGLRQQYLQVPGGDSKCYTYPFPSMCSGAEAFAESIALYVVHETYYFSYTGHGYFDFPGKYPNQYEWLKDNVFGGVEFK